MKYSQRKSIILLVLLITIVNFACGSNVNPTDPRIAPNISPYLSIFTEYMRYLKALPEGQFPIPIILEPKPPLTIPTTVTFSGFSPNQSDLNANQPPEIHLYVVRPNGCEGEIIRVEELGTVILAGESEMDLDSRKWTIESVELNADILFVAATITVDGREGDYSEVMVLDPQKVMPKVISPDPESPLLAKIIISGQAYPGFCLSIYREESLIKDIDIPYSIEDPMKLIDWSTGSKNDQLIRIYEDTEKNKFKIKIKGYSTIQPLELNYKLDIPKVQWPFGTDINGFFQADSSMSCVTTFAGTNDYYFDMYYKKEFPDPLHTGIDLANNSCTKKVPDKEVRAVSSGVLYYSGYTDGVGNAIAIDHGNWVSLYWHLDERYVSYVNGTSVKIKQGQVIGKMGDTGIYADGVHLHLQMFWWSDISSKIKSGAGTPNGAILINPNPPELVVCSGPTGLWINDWSDVEIMDNFDGTQFTTCTLNKNCECPGQ